MSVLDKAKLVVVPSGHKTSKLHAQVPTSGAGDLTYSMNTTAQYTDVDGIIKTAAINEPRVCYEGGGCGKALTENGTNNTIQYSKDFANSYWTKTNASIVSNSITSPEDLVNASKLVEGTSNSVHSIKSPNTQQLFFRSWSIYVKAAGRSWVLLSTQNLASKGQFFNISNGTIGTGGSALLHTNIIDCGNGWYRINVQGAQFGFGDSFNISLADSDGGVSYQGDGVSGVHIWQADNTVKTLSSPIYTNGSIVTHGDATYLTQTLQSSINSQAGVVYFNGAWGNGYSQAQASNYFVASSNFEQRIQIYFTKPSSNTYLLRATMFVNNVFVVQIQGNITKAEATSFNKIAFRYKANNCSLWLNGVKFGEQLSNPAMAAGAMNVYGISNESITTREIAFFDYLTDEEIAAL